MKKLFPKILLGLLIAYFAILGSNLIGSKFENLSQTDQAVLNEFSEFSHSQPVWEDYDLKDRSLLFINKDVFGSAYLINPAQEPSAMFAKEIEVPGGIKAYRVSGFLPSVLKLKMEPGNFNPIEDFLFFESHPKVLGTPVYFLKYNKDNIDKEYSSYHFMPFLAHEAFHFYMQGNWPAGSRFAGDLSDKDLALLKEEYSVLAKMQQADLDHESVDWKALGREYVEVMQKRIENNPTYLADELEMETAEGTATYVGIKAARDVHYDFGVMYFPNAANVSFNQIMPLVEDGSLSKNMLADSIPYDTGAQLCFLLDNMQVEGWQEKLNKQTKENPVTLYDLVKEAVEKN